MTNHTDKELLMLAARAAGVEARVDFDGSEYFHYEINDCTYKHWSPLTDDGDALRLAVKFGIAIRRISNKAMASSSAGQFDEYCDSDPYAATRRAIVRAAASIGDRL